MPTYASAIEE